MIGTASTKTSESKATISPVPLKNDVAIENDALRPYSEVLRMQRVVGNSAVSRIIQAKLKVSTPGDRYEREADRVADQVMRMTHPGAMSVSRLVFGDNSSYSHAATRGALNQAVQRACTHCEDAVQRKAMCDHCEAEVQRSAKSESIQMSAAGSGGHTASSQLSTNINAARGGGQSLSQSQRAFFESRFNYDFSAVRIHTDNSAAQAADAVRARAFTIGQDVMFGRGEYAPDNANGRRLIAHELAHVIQQ